MESRTYINRILISALCFSVVFFYSCKKGTDSGMILVTASPAGNSIDMVSGEGWRYEEGAAIFMVNPEKPSSFTKLTNDFYSACSPDLSSDGRFMVFTGQKKKGDPWQLWQIEFKNGLSRQLTDSTAAFTDPVFLPGDKLVYTANTNMKDCKALFACNADGSSSRQLTFHPHANFATLVMKDGRLLVISRQMLPEKNVPFMMVIRPDGTKADIFYGSPDGFTIASKSRESSDGKIYFIEKDSTGKGSVISIQYNRPLHSRKIVTQGITGSFSSVYPSTDGNLLVSYSAEGKPFDLYEFNLKENKPGRKLFGIEGYNVSDIMITGKYQRPKKLPSEVDPGVKTGLLLIQDVNFQALTVPDPNSKKAVKIEIAGIDSSMGIVNVQEDGSVYLKVLANRPFKIRTLDNNNRVINEGSQWLWLRPNERRGFVGLRDDDEMAPINRVSMAVKKDPEIVPVVGSEINEKEVELE